MVSHLEIRLYFAQQIKKTRGKGSKLWIPRQRGDWLAARGNKRSVPYYQGH